MRTKRAIWFTVAFAIFSLVAIFVFQSGKARLVFYQNGRPLASAPISLFIGSPPFIETRLDAEGGYDFPWALKSGDEALFYGIQTRNGEITAFSSVPRGKTVLVDSCSGGVTKITTTRYFLGAIRISERTTLIDVSGQTNSMKSPKP